MLSHFCLMGIMMFQMLLIGQRSGHRSVSHVTSVHFKWALRFWLLLCMAEILLVLCGELCSWTLAVISSYLLMQRWPRTRRTRQYFFQPCPFCTENFPDAVNLWRWGFKFTVFCWLVSLWLPLLLRNSSSVRYFFWFPNMLSSCCLISYKSHDPVTS